jgi:hypothetical protein
MSFPMESFSESVVSLSLERAHWVGSSLEETSSFDETSLVDEEESLSSSSLLSPLTCRFFDVAMDSSATSSSSSLAYLRLFSLEAIRLLRQMDSSSSSVGNPVYMESPASIPRGTHGCLVKRRDAWSLNGHSSDGQ